MGTNNSRFSKRRSDRKNSGSEDDRIPDTNILMLGLDRAGKTSILNKLRHNETVTTYTPTIGFNLETLPLCKGIRFSLWDIGGQKRIRPLWRSNFFNLLDECRGVIFVIDSSDTDEERLSEARQFLFDIFQCPQLKAVPVLIIANKQDLPGALSPHKIAKKFSLYEHKENEWTVQGASGTTGQCLQNGIRCLASMVKRREKVLKKENSS